MRRLRDAVRVDPGMPAADRRKLSRHRGWYGEARTGLVSKLRRRLMSLGAGSRVGASPKTPDGYARESSRRAKSDPWCHSYDYIWHTTVARFAPHPPFWVCLHTAHDIHGSRERQARLSRQASAPALERLQAAKSMGGQCGSSWARRSEHVEATLSGWRSVWMESDEPALTQKKLAENTIFYHLIR